MRGNDGLGGNSARAPIQKTKKKATSPSTERSLKACGELGAGPGAGASGKASAGRSQLTNAAPATGPLETRRTSLQNKGL